MDKETVIKKHNTRRQIFDLIYKEKEISKLRLASELDLSLPTITQNLKYFEHETIIKRSGHFESTGGRKPDAYTCISDAKIAIGVHIMKERIIAVAVDLYGNIIKKAQISAAYFHEHDYFKTVGNLVDELVDQTGYPSDRVLGVGIALTALLSKNRQQIKRSVILGEIDRPVDGFSKWIKYPCQVYHDSEAAANGEMWFSHGVDDAMYLGLNYHMNGMLIMNGKIHEGKEFTGGLVEHMTLFPGGKDCYCGRKGCMSAYCSGRTLFEDNEDSCNNFFDRLRLGFNEESLRWAAYLENLSIAVGSLYSLLDCEIIMGGVVGSYMTQDDAQTIQRLAMDKYEFKPKSDFVILGQKNRDISVCGAAIYFITSFIDTI